MSDMTPPPVPPAPPYAPAPGTDSSARVLAGLGYIIGIIALVALLLEPYKNDPFVKPHAYQGLALWVIAVVISWIPFVGWLVSLLVLVLAIIGAINAFQGKAWEMPVLGSMLREWFNY